MGSSGSNRSFSLLDSCLAMTYRVCKQACRAAMAPATWRSVRYARCSLLVARGLGRSLERIKNQHKFSTLPWAPTQHNVLSYSESDWSWLIWIRSLMVLCEHYSTLSSPHSISCDKISLTRQVFRSFAIIGFYEKAVWGVVKSWEFEANLRCSKRLRIWTKISMKRVFDEKSTARRGPSDDVACKLGG